MLNFDYYLYLETIKVYHISLIDLYLTFRETKFNMFHAEGNSLLYHLCLLLWFKSFVLWFFLLTIFVQRYVLMWCFYFFILIVNEILRLLTPISFLIENVEELRTKTSMLKIRNLNMPKCLSSIICMQWWINKIVNRKLILQKDITYFRYKKYQSQRNCRYMLCQTSRV